MQTKQQIQELLASAGIEPNKRRGQHFLIDLNLMRFLLDAAGIGPDDIALEPGCGTGSLTEALTELAGKVIAVEVDPNLAKIAKGKLDLVSPPGRVELIDEDILETKHKLNPAVVETIQNARKKYTGRLILIGNLPYNVAGPVMLNLIAGPVVADCMYVTVQKEVAERMAAAPGDWSYGVLSILMATAGEVEVLKILKPTVFWPMPQVKSAMVSFNRSRAKVGEIKSMELLRQVVNLFMQHRRKMLKACTKFAKDRLAQIQNWPDIFAKAQIEPHLRPEELSPEKYLQIANLCFEELCL